MHELPIVAFIEARLAEANEEVNYECQGRRTGGRMIPLPAPINFSMPLDETYPTAESVRPVAKYRNTESMDDDGWIVYKFEGIA